jgi:hypothetical protein
MLTTIAEEKGIVEEGKKNENMPKNCEYKIAAMILVAFVGAVKNHFVFTRRNVGDKR